MTVQASATAPSTSGAYTLELQLVREGQFWFDQYADVAVAVAPSTYSASYGVAGVPSTWTSGQTQTFPVVVTNTGNQVWPSTGTNRVRLSAHFATQVGAASSSWLTDVRVGLSADLAPGASVTLQVTTTAPASAVVLEFQMVREPQTWFKQYADVRVGSPPAAAYSASYEVGGVPSTWSTGQTQTFYVTVTNTGNQVWPSTGTNRVRLGAHFATQAGLSSGSWLNDVRVELPADVAPGASVSLQVSIAAPATASVLELQMVKEAQFWFSQFADVGVGPPASAMFSAGFDVSGMPTSWVAGQSQTFPVVVTNTGNQTWPSTGTNRARLAVHFASQPGGSATPWFDDVRVDLPTDLMPGASATIDVTTTAAGAAQVLEAAISREGLSILSQFADVAIGVQVPVGTVDPWASALGLSSAVVKTVTSPAGTWRLVQTATALYRSGGSGLWQRIGRPSGEANTGIVTIGDDGVVFMLSSDGAIYPTKRVYRFGMEWAGPSLVLSNPSTVYAGAGAIVTDGVKVLVIESKTGRTAVSTDKGVTWTITASVYPAQLGYEVTVLGGYAHVVSNPNDGTLAYSRFSMSANTVSPVITGVVGSEARVVATPASTSSLYLVSTSSNGSASIRKSTNSGANWTTVVSNEPPPTRVGVSFGAATMGVDGLIHRFGSVVESGRVAVYDAALDPVAMSWAPLKRTQTDVSSGSLVVWPTQRANGDVVVPTLWTMRPSGSNFWAADVSAGGVESPWVTSTTSAFGSTMLEGLPSAPTDMVLSPAAAWRLVRTSSDLYRSTASGGSWEKIGRPPGKSATGPAAIGDDGVVYMLSDDGGIYPNKQLYRFSNDWHGPASLLINPTQVYAGGAALVADGVRLMAIESGTGRTAVSTDRGNSWVTTATITAASSYRATILGDNVHILADSGSGSMTYVRFSFVSNTVTKTMTGVPGTIATAKVMSSADSVSHLWIVSANGPVLAESLDSGTTWTTVANGPATAPLTRFGRLGTDAAGFGIATCSANSYVFGVTHPLGSAAGWSLPRALALGAGQAASILSTGNRVDGAASEADQVWVSFNTGAGWSLERIDPSRLSPEAAFGRDGYGLIAGGVNLAVGGLVETVTDVSIAGVGPALELTRTYNSEDRRVGLFGRGWSSSYDVQVYENCVTKDVIVLKADGHREFFQWDGVGAYITPGGYTSKLVKTGTTGWTLTEANGYVSTFRSDGRLISIADADNQKLNLTWNASNQLTAVTDQVSGRALTFTYSSGKVASVSTTSVTGPGYSGTLTWNYVYSGSNLAKVCDPRNNDPATGLCVGYTVAAGRISRITDPNGHVDRSIGYVNGKLAWSEDGAGNRTTYAYPTAYKTIVTDPNQHSVTSEFDAQFRLIKQTDAAGGVTSFEYSVAGLRNKTIDPLGNATSLVFDAKGNVTSETNALGFTRYMAYDAYNNLTQSRDARSASSTDNTYLVATTWDGVSRNKLTETTPPTSQLPLGTVQSWAYSNGTEPAVGGGTTPKGLLKTATNTLGTVDTFLYDSAGNLRETIDRRGLHTTYTYDALGRQVSQTVYPTSFPAGVVTTFEYDQLGNLVARTDPAVTNAVTGDLHQRKTVSIYDGASNLSQTTETDIGGSGHADPPRTVHYTYDGADRPIAASNPEGGITTTEYDAVGNITAVVDARGTRHETIFDEHNLPTSTTVKAAVVDLGESVARDVVTSTVGYDAAGKPITSTDARGVTVTLAYDAIGQVTSKTLNGYHERNGSTRDIVLQATTYDPAGHPLTQTTGNGRRTEQYTYDPAGRMVSAVLDPTGLNRTTTITYDAAGNVTRTTLSDGTRTEETRTAYDPGGQVIATTVENGAVDLTTSYTRDNRGLVTSMVEPRGNVAGASPASYRVDYQLDALGRTTTTTSPPVSVSENGATTPAMRPSITTGFDTYGQATQTRDERGYVTTQTFDRLGRVTVITHPAAAIAGGATSSPTEQFSFDPVGNLLTRTDRRGETTTYTYDGLNRAITQTDPAVGAALPGVIHNAYDDSGNLTLTIDQLGARTEATFDDAGRQRTATSVVRNATSTPDRYTTTYDYDDLGNLIMQQSPTGDVTRWEYSVASEPTKQIDPALAETTTSFDMAGRAIATTDPLGRTTTFQYDLAGRQTSQQHFAANSALLSTSTTAYDAAGNVVASTAPRGAASGNPAAFTTSYTYDALSRLVAVTQPTSPAHAVETSYRYDASGNQTLLTDGRGYSTISTYNPWGLPDAVIEPATATYPNASDRTWTTQYDPAGLAARTIEPGGVTVERTFDELGRLVSEVGAGPDAATATRTFTYDAAGHRVSASAPAGVIGFEYDDRGLLTATTGPTQYQSSFTYDAAGRMLSRTDAAGVTTFSWNSRSQLATVADPLIGSTRSNTFDAVGQLTHVAYSGGATRDLLYDDFGRLASDVLATSGGAVTAG